MTLRLTGREGVKDFVREEISGLWGYVIDWKQDNVIGWNRAENQKATK